MDKHIFWKKEYQPNGSVSWVAKNVNDYEDLGHLSLVRWGGHVHWSWWQVGNICMSPGCLEEVRDKQKELFKDRKRDECLTGENNG